MTDVVKLAKKLYRKVNQQTTPEELGWIDLVYLVQDAIGELYILSGRQSLYSDDMFELDEEEQTCTFSADLSKDEQDWVVLDAEVEFYKWVINSVDDLSGYSTDAMTVTHADRPYININNTIQDRQSKMNRIWYSMTRYNQLEVGD